MSWKNRNFVKQALQYGVYKYGLEVPVNAVYGQRSGVAWVCSDLNFYPDGKSIDVFLYDSKKSRWTETRLDCGLIYNDLVSYLSAHDLFGVDCKWSIKYKGTFQKGCPTGKKSKNVGLKQANNSYYDRGSKGGKFWETSDKTGLLVSYTVGTRRTKEYPDRNAYRNQQVASTPEVHNNKERLSPFSPSVPKFGAYC